MTAMTERRARMLLRLSVVSAVLVSAVSLGFALHWFILGREATLPFAAWCALTSLCLYLSARWLRRRQLPL